MFSNPSLEQHACLVDRWDWCCLEASSKAIGFRRGKTKYLGRWQFQFLFQCENPGWGTYCSPPFNIVGKKLFEIMQFKYSLLTSITWLLLLFDAMDWWVLALMNMNKDFYRIWVQVGMMETTQDSVVSNIVRLPEPESQSFFNCSQMKPTLKISTTKISFDKLQT